MEFLHVQRERYKVYSHNGGEGRVYNIEERESVRERPV